MLGISIKPTIGIGDGLQYSSLPENYFKATGKKLYDVTRPWFFDYNPYVERDPNVKPETVKELWNFSPKQYDWPVPRQSVPRVYLSNAEIWASLFGVPATLIRPRLYKYESVPFEKRSMILLHTDGRSHGAMPSHVVDHVLKKYKPSGRLFHIGSSPVDYGIPKITTPTLWDLAALIAESQMLIGMDSGPSWIAACYPDVIVKKLRTKPTVDMLKSWIPLEINNIHSHWDDRCHQVFNPSEDDVGFTASYKRI
jgi:hypothetical protein